MIFETSQFWAGLGIGLLIIEVFTLGLVAAVFGAAAIAIAALVVTGVLPALPGQLAGFALISVVILVALRHFYPGVFRGLSSGKPAIRTQGAELIGRSATAIDDFVDGGGNVMMSGAKWDAKSDHPIVKGQAVRVVGREGITLIVEPTNVRPVTPEGSV